jgi:hypothetical protein
MSGPGAGALANDGGRNLRTLEAQDGEPCRSQAHPEES